MTDRMKVLKGVEACEPSSIKRRCRNCPYKMELNCDYTLWHDVMDLLKEQDPVEAELEGGGSSWWWVCGECHGQISKGDRYCRHCGHEIKWE